MNFLQQIGKALKRPIFDGSNGRAGAFWGAFRSAAGYDYERECGKLWKSSIPLALLKWEQRACVEAEPVLQRRDAAGKWRNEPSHAALDLLAHPNPFFDTHQLLDALRFDYHVSGNAYLWKARSGSKRVVQLWWIPSWMIDPRWSEGGTAFIECYEYRVNGETYSIPVGDVVHFRNGIDPEWGGRKGLSDFAAILREVCTDNEAGVIAAALCKNMGIPGVIISPKGGDDAQLTAAQRASIAEIWKEKFTGNKRGEPFIQSIPIEISMPGFDLQQLAFDKLRSIPETRISAAFGIPAAVVGLQSGMENSKTKGGRGDEREQAYESCIIPTLYTMARALTRGWLAETEDTKNVRVWFDLSEVRCLQQDQDALFKRLSEAYKAGWVKRSDAREAAGLAADESDNVYITDVTQAQAEAAAKAAAEANPDAEDDPVDGKPTAEQDEDNDNEIQ